MWQALIRSSVVVGFVVLLGSFAGGVHPLGDSLAVFRPVLVLGLLLVTVLAWRWTAARAVAFVAALAGLGHLTGFVNWSAPGEATELTLYQKNLLFRPRNRSAFLADVRLIGADFVTLQEVSRANAPILEDLRDLYPHQLLCNGHTVGAVAILSRTPLDGTDCGLTAGFARAETEIGGRAVQIYALHLHWPWPYAQQRQVDLILPQMAPLPDGVTLVGGDFNMVASGASVRRIARATQTGRVGPLVQTFSLLGYPLGIDHVLATGGRGTLEARPLLGADHMGLVARIAF